ncbi:MAG: methionine biosynthesis protein MetW [Alphaproteobacteria bacterium]|nr:MAG: methionine biosynthesis protein MetW [Alphaproteobacteria bacterium]
MVDTLRSDLKVIADFITPGARLLDIGCGDGALLAYLRDTAQVDGRGMELSQVGVNACVTKGLTVIQGDADLDLKDYPTDAFDYVILSQTLQATRNPKEVLQQLLRISNHVVVSFPNFGNWKVRLALLFKGRMPVTKSLDQPWYSTPNIHFCTIRDFIALCHELGAKIEQGVSLNAANHIRPINGSLAHANWMGEQAIFLLSRGNGAARKQD